MRYINMFHGLTPESLRPVRNPELVPKWMPRGRTTIVPRASHALYLGWQVMRLRRGDRFLCPAFTCNTVNLPLEKAGGRPVFFNINRDMTIDWDHLESLLSRSKRPKALVWFHYLGLPLEFDRVREFCREQDLLFIEDCAHALFSAHKGRPVGSFGDVATFSIRKAIPVLQAGALVVNNPKFPKKPRVPWRKESASQQAYLRNKESYMHRLGMQAFDRTGKVERPYYREALNEQGVHYGDPSEFWPIDPLSQMVMHNASPEKVRRARRRNFLAYLRELKDVALLGKLPAGASPMGFAIIAKRRKHLRDRLLRCGIEAVTHWWAPLMPRGVEKRFGDAMYLADHELTLPCHQDLEVEDIRYICRCLKKLL